MDSKFKGIIGIIVLTLGITIIILIMRNISHSNDIHNINVTTVEIEKENEYGLKEKEYQVQDEDGKAIISYTEDYIAPEGNGEVDSEEVQTPNGKTTYQIKDNAGRTIGTTEDKDDIRLYIDNPSYGEYAPSITE